MSIILPKSIFLHAGRTGGHWVSSVLWKAGLVQRRIFPIHAHLTDIADDPDVVARAFRFCFVRHPLNWLASLWRHEMEFGWADTEITEAAASESFVDFLENMLRCWPSGPCSQHLRPYTDASVFVGRTESLSNDLRIALANAGEVFDPSVLDLPIINASEVESIKHAAKAPRSLLAEIMAAEQAYNTRYNYGDVPDILVDENLPRLIWPLVPLANPSLLSDINLAVRVRLTSTRFDYRFEGGDRIDSDGAERRCQLTLIDAVHALAIGERCAVFGEYDPFFAFLMKMQGFKSVDFVCLSSQVLPLGLIAAIGLEINIMEHADFAAQAASDQYDAVILCDTVDAGPLGEAELIRAATCLKPGGTLIFTALLIKLDSESPVKAIWPGEPGTLYGRRMVRYSLPYLVALLQAFGFSAITSLSFQRESMSGRSSPLADFAAASGDDPEELLGKVVLRAFRGERENDGDRPDLSTVWGFRSPMNLIGAPLDGVARAARVSIATLIADIEQERRCRAAAEQGLMHREQELIQTRHALAANVIDANYHREQLKLTRERLTEIECAYLDLKTRMNFLD